MRMITDDAVIERAGVHNETEFGIQFSAKMARILSKQIYSNVIQAPIREIICNAWDSHRAANKLSTPIRVHLPNQMEPWFEVQDEGLGMDALMMQVQYTTYGASTKAQTNDDIGGLGLGCKAPFAYTDAFTVTSVHDHVRRSYSLFKNERGIPALALMGEEACDAPNGVTVRVPVKKVDFDRFRTETQQVLRWFDTPFYVTGNSQYNPIKLAPLDVAKGNSWCLQANGYYDRNPSVAVMGNVAYPIQADQISNSFEQLIESFNLSVVLHFQIGELDISPTREALNYDPLTVKVLEARLTQVLQECRAQLEAKLSTCANAWDARHMVHSWRSNSATDTLVQVLCKHGFNLQWKSTDVSKSTLYLSDMPGVSKETASIMMVNETVRGRSVNYVEARRKTIFVDGDCSDASARARHAFHGKPGSVYLIQGSAEQRARMFEFLGQPQTTLASSLPRPERKQMVFKGNQWLGNRGWGRRSKAELWDTDVQISKDQGGFYVTQVHMDPLDVNDNILSLNTMVNLAVKLGFMENNTSVWGINKTNCKLLKDAKNWHRFDEWLRAQVQVKISDAQVCAQIHIRQQLTVIEQALNMNSQSLVKHMRTHWCNLQNPLGSLARAYVDAQVSQMDAEKAQNLKMAARIVGLEIKPTNTVDVENLWNLCMNQYPLIKFLRAPCEDHMWQHMTDYVKAMDQNHVPQLVA